MPYDAESDVQRYRRSRVDDRGVPIDVGGPMPTYGWEAFFGALQRQKEEANAAGMNYRADLSGIGADGSLGNPGGGGLQYPSDRGAIAGNAFLGKLVDDNRASEINRRVATAQAQQAEQAASDKLVGSLQQSENENAVASAALQGGDGGGQLDLGSPDGRATFLSRLPPPVRAAYEKQFAATDMANLDTKDKQASIELKKAQAQKALTPGGSQSGMNALYAATDPKAIADRIRAGEHPPDMSQYGRPVQGAIASELAKPGPNGEAPFDLSSALRTWNSQKKLNSTMNGSQQVRLSESMKSAMSMYDAVDTLANQWDSAGIGPLSRANLTLAQQGALGPDAQKIATQLTGQIGQLTSDIATIEQGGLTPTNESRSVAEKSMQDWWGKGTIHAMTEQGRANVKIRELARSSQDTFTPGNKPGVGGEQGPPSSIVTPTPAGGQKRKIGRYEVEIH